MVKQQPENRDLDYLISFPVTAADLPNAHQACLGLPLPVDVEIPELDTILGGTKMRGRKPKTCDPPWIASILAQVPDASAHDAIRKSLLANAGGLQGSSMSLLIGMRQNNHCKALRHHQMKSNHCLRFSDLRGHNRSQKRAQNQ